MIEKLREKTENQHRELETRLDFFNQAWGIDQYSRLLGNFFRLYQHLEPHLLVELKAVGFELDYSQRRKLPSLYRDLENLDLSGRWRDEASLSVDFSLPSGHAAVGLLYVVEGSTLGGQLISRYFKKKLAIDSSSGGSFFSVYGSKTQHYWMEFLKVLTAYADLHPDQESSILQGASDGFDLFTQALKSSSMRTNLRKS